MGMLLDPLADKLMIAAAFITLVQFNPLLVPAWMAVAFIVREFLVSGLRGIAASEGFTIQASALGKFKMLVQIISVVAVILARRWHEWAVARIYFFPVYWVARLAIWFMVLLSLVSALDYFIAFWARIDHKSEKRRRRAFVLAGGESAMSRLFETPSEKASENMTAREVVRDAAPPAAEFSLVQRRILLRIAHEAILSVLERRPFPEPSPLPAALSDPRGVFTTLYLRGGLPGDLGRQLRACVGYAVPIAPLYRAAPDTAR